MRYFFINTDEDCAPKGEPAYLKWLELGVAAADGPPKFGENLKRLSPGDICLMYVDGIGIAAAGRVLERWNGRTYRNPLIYEIYNEDQGEYRIKVEWFKKFSPKPISPANVKRLFGYQPRSALNPIDKKRSVAERLAGGVPLPQFLLPQELPPDPVRRYPVGAKKQITVNAYERSSAARRDCLRRWTFKCSVCEKGMDEIYGPAGKDVIDVHHLVPLSQVDESYRLDPVQDLRPVCPNCHTMLHRKPGRRVYSIGELQAILRQACGRKG